MSHNHLNFNLSKHELLAFPLSYKPFLPVFSILVIPSYTQLRQKPSNSLWFVFTIPLEIQSTTKVCILLIHYISQIFHFSPSPPPSRPHYLTPLSGVLLHVKHKLCNLYTLFIRDSSCICSYHSLPSALTDCVGGFQDHCRVQWFTGQTHRTQKTCCTHGYGLLQQKIQIKRAKVHMSESRRNQLWTSSCSLPLESCE